LQELEESLASLLGRHVDVVTTSALRNCGDDDVDNRQVRNIIQHLLPMLTTEIDRLLSDVES
jgi:hypothetical protein